MTIVSAFLVPGHPLLQLRPETKPWGALRAGHEVARKALEASKPDVVLLYSTRWFAVLDQLWQARPILQGVHVDEDWYELGDMYFNMRIDTALAEQCAAASKQAGISAKTVDYEGFPIDSGTITTCNLLDPDHRYQYVFAANNLYHDWQTTEKLAAVAVAEAQKQGKRIAVIGVGGLSGGAFRTEIEFDQDRLSTPEDNQANREFLKHLEDGFGAWSQARLEAYLHVAKPDMGMKHLAWIKGALGSKSLRAELLGYGPTYGCGAAVMQFHSG